ncbi:endolytic transglycosylase MltG [Telmatospirillum sp.]|uniref:endolytic transglycosylase MltG n=1 Tax=Telmatospirillum sp. TaxID=2079197 RepID=UPI00284E2ADA|nr:endolytic transglycosylase MltG [Telmatospirillum sp.]MDR3437190.1 endolytic transglycosylase MltG [Telmatospirillum sp.]
MTRWPIRLLLVLTVLLVALGGVYWWARAKTTEPGPAERPATVVVPKGISSSDIGSLLKEAGIIEHPWLFVVASRLDGRPVLQAGEYSFAAHVSVAGIVDMMRRGQTVIHKLTVAEGLTVYQILAQLRQAGSLVGNTGQPPEDGSLLPQTYFFSYGDTRESLLLRMTHAMNEAIDELWPARSPDVGLANKVDAIILASIVERETAISEERPHVAAVFLNRLKSHMKLQSDPTVIYAISNGEGVLDRPLGHDDLAFKSPYNTYLVDGLPVGPICNPGRASLAAVLHPAASDDLYFVADGSGGHVFSRSLAEHNQNVSKLRRMENGVEEPPTVKKTKSSR